MRKSTVVLLVFLEALALAGVAWWQAGNIWAWKLALVGG